MPEVPPTPQDDESLLNMLLGKIELLTDRILAVEHQNQGVPMASKKGRMLQTTEDRVDALETSVQANTDEIAVNSRLLLHVLQ